MTGANPYVYEGTVERVVDGDTAFLRLTKKFVLLVDFGFHILDTVSLDKTAIIDCRLAGINAPELSSHDPKVKAAAHRASNELERLLQLGPLTVTTSKADKYGRWLAAITARSPSGPVNVNQAMLDGGFAVPYAG